MALISYVENKGMDDEKGFSTSKELFKTSPKFNVGAFAVMLILVAIYAFFW